MGSYHVVSLLTLLLLLFIIISHTSLDSPDGSSYTTSIKAGEQIVKQSCIYYVVGYGTSKSVERQTDLRTQTQGHRDRQTDRQTDGRTDGYCQLAMKL